MKAPKILNCSLLCATFLFLFSCSKSDGNKLGPAESVSHAVESVSKGDSLALWHSLPPSYRNDINGVLQLMGQKMPANVWDNSFALINRLGKVMQNKKQLFIQMMGENMPKDMTKADVEKSIHELGEVFSLIASSEIAKVESLKTIDLEKLAGTTGNKVLGLIINNSTVNSLIKNSPDIKAKNLQEALSQVKVELVSEKDNYATVKITSPDGKVEVSELIKVEDKWVEKKMSEEFKTNIAKARQELENGFPDLQKNMMGIAMVQGMADGFISGLENAKTADDIKKVFGSMNLDPSMILGAGNKLNGGSAKSPEIPNNEEIKPKK